MDLKLATARRAARVEMIEMDESEEKDKMARQREFEVHVSPSMTIEQNLQQDLHTAIAKVQGTRGLQAYEAAETMTAILHPIPISVLMLYMLFPHIQTVM